MKTRTKRFMPGWAVLAALWMGFAACPERKPPGPSQKQLSDKVPFKSGARQGIAWVLARRITRTTKASGRGSLPGCTITTHSVRHVLVVQLGETKRRVQFHVSHSGDTTKLPRYDVKPGSDGRCIAARPKGGKGKWHVIRLKLDGTPVHVPDDTVAADSADSPCARAGTLRQALLKGMSKRQTLQYMDKRQLFRFLIDRPADTELYDRFVVALLDHPLAVLGVSLPKKDLPELQKRICSRPALVKRLRYHLDGASNVDSYAFRNATLFLERCRDAASLKILCDRLKKTRVRKIHFLASSLAQLAGDLKGAPSECVTPMARHLTANSTGVTDRIYLVWALAVTNNKPARAALRRFVGSGKTESVQWPADYDALVKHVSGLDSRKLDDYARSLAAAWLRTNGSKARKPPLARHSR